MPVKLTHPSLLVLTAMPDFRDEMLSTPENIRELWDNIKEMYTKQGWTYERFEQECLIAYVHLPRIRELAGAQSDALVEIATEGGSTDYRAMFFHVVLAYCMRVKMPEREATAMAASAISTSARFREYMAAVQEQSDDMDAKAAEAGAPVADMDTGTQH